MGILRLIVGGASIYFSCVYQRTELHPRAKPHSLMTTLGNLNVSAPHTHRNAPSALTTRVLY